jgi:hypothetical protein
VIHRSKLKHVELTLAAGDLFDAKVDAIVNSEQSDFVLSKDPESLSGQIRSRYGVTIQGELDAATNGQALGAGTVLDTSGALCSNVLGRVRPKGWCDATIWLLAGHAAVRALEVLGRVREQNSPVSGTR